MKPPWEITRNTTTRKWKHLAKMNKLKDKEVWQHRGICKKKLCRLQWTKELLWNGEERTRQARPPDIPPFNHTNLHSVSAILHQLMQIPSVLTNWSNKTLYSNVYRTRSPILCLCLCLSWQQSVSMFPLSCAHETLPMLPCAMVALKKNTIALQEVVFPDFFGLFFFWTLNYILYFYIITHNCDFFFETISDIKKKKKPVNASQNCRGLHRSISVSHNVKYWRQPIQFR